MAALVLAASGTATSAPAQAAASSATTASPATSTSATSTTPTTSWFWEWSDGSRARQRALAEADFGTWEHLPAVAVASAPRRPGVRVLLQIHDGRRWRTEDSAVTDATGRATLRLNPYCEDGAWCTGSSRYRLRAAESTAALTVTFRRRPSPP